MFFLLMHLTFIVLLGLYTHIYYAIVIILMMLLFLSNFWHKNFLWDE